MVSENEVLEAIKAKGVKFIHLQFVDLWGNPKSCEATVPKFKDALEDGMWFDGSSVEGFTRIHESDMILVPDMETFSVMPWTDNKVARIICDSHTPDGKPFAGDPRLLLKRVVDEVKKEGFEFKVGPEVEFYLFKNGDNSGRPTPHDSAGYFDYSPHDLGANVKREVVPYLEAMGIQVDMTHHECGPGQHELDFKYCTAVKAADHVITLKNIVKNTASKYGLFASFMPKPVFGLPGSGMHVHQSLWKAGINTFFDTKGEYKLSQTARWFIAGQLKHARAIAAVTNPIVNSYKRLVSGFEAPVYICWGRMNRSALIRVPEIQPGRESSSRCELRCPDPSCNPYLAFAVMLAAGLDGIRNKMDPPKPVEEDVYDFDDEKLAKFYIQTLPKSLEEATLALKQDKVIGEVLGEHVLKTLIEGQLQQWNEYKIQVTDWEIKRYLPTT